MITYQQPPTMPSTMTAIPTPEELEALKQAADAADRQNEIAWAELRTRWERLREDTKAFLGVDVVRLPPRDPMRAWFNSGPFSKSLRNFRRTWVSVLGDKVSQLLAQEAAKKRGSEEAAKKVEQDAKPARAVIFLIKHGKVAGVDFTPESAVYEANALARDLMLAAAKPKEGEHVSFGGDDNCEGCDGWDGESHRCQCGNRRVYWETFGDFDDFEAGRAYAYGQAD